MSSQHERSPGQRGFTSEDHAAGAKLLVSVAAIAGASTLEPRKPVDQEGASWPHCQRSRTLQAMGTVTFARSRSLQSGWSTATSAPTAYFRLPPDRVVE